MPSPVLRRTLLVAVVCLAAPLAAQDSAAEQQSGRNALKLPVVPIATVLEDRNGDTVPDRLLQPVHVRGVVTIGSGVVADDRTQIYVQDTTGGVYVFSRSARQPQVKAGDVIDVGGIVEQYRGAVQLLRPAYEVVGSTAVPKPVKMTISEALSWRWYGRLIEVEGTIEGDENQGFNLAVELRDHAKSIDLILPPKVVRAVPSADLRRGTRIRATGVASIYSPDRPYRQGFRMVIGSADDIRVIARPLPSWVRPASTAAIAALIVLAAAGAATLLVRRFLRRRRREFAVLSEVSGSVVRAGTNIESLLETAVSTMSRHELIDGAVIHLVEGDRLQLKGTFGIEAELAHDVDEQVRARVSPALVRRDSLDVDIPSAHPLLCIPLQGRSGTVGVMTAFTSRRHTATPDEAATIAAAANVVALGIENVRAMEEAEQQQSELKQLAITDPLTGLYNRRFLDEYLRIHIPMARRQATPVAFIAIDLDHFKIINDTYGHDAGDVVLREFGATVRQMTRASDLPVRLGGEEFLVVMPETGESGARAWVGRIQDELQRVDFVAAGLPHEVRLTASFGVALYPEHGDQVAQLLRCADEALYESKRGGRNCVTLAPLRLIEA